VIARKNGVFAGADGGSDHGLFPVPLVRRGFE
jgi:hypothetical protein